jgi:hypothetical protein
MKPDWDKLSAEFKDSASVVIADVDCTAGGKSLCEQVGVRGYPTIKHGDPDDLQDYNGGRTLKDLQKFAADMGPACGPANLDLCDDAKKAKIGELTAMSEADRQTAIDDGAKQLEKIEADFKAFVEGLQKQYTDGSEKKDKDLQAAKDSGLGLMKAVHAFEKKRAKSEL